MIIGFDCVTARKETYFNIISLISFVTDNHATAVTAILQS